MDTFRTGFQEEAFKIEKPERIFTEWMTPRGIAKQFGISTEIVDELAFKFGRNLKEPTAQKPVRGVLRLHYAPEIVTAIAKQLEADPPSNWTPNIYYGQTVKFAYEVVQKEKPDLFSYFRMKDRVAKGQLGYRYYSPEGLAAIEQFYGKILGLPPRELNSDEKMGKLFGTMEYWYHWKNPLTEIAYQITNDRPGLITKTLKVLDKNSRLHEVHEYSDVLVQELKLRLHEQVREDLQPDTNRVNRAIGATKKMHREIIEDELTRGY